MQHWHSNRLEIEIGLMSGCAADRTVVITGKREHTTVPRCACEIGVTNCIKATINSWPLTVPDANNTVVFCASEQIDLLASPHSCGGKFLVYSGYKVNVIALQKGFGAPKRLVVTPEGRASIA